MCTCSHVSLRGLCDLIACLAVATGITSSLNMRFGPAEFFHQLKSYLEALVNACVRSLYRREVLATVELSAFVATECLEEKLGLLAVEFDGEGPVTLTTLRPFT